MTEGMQGMGEGMGRTAPAAGGSTARERILQIVQDAGEDGISFSAVKRAAGANAGTIRQMVDSMLRQGTITETPGEGPYGATRTLRVAGVSAPAESGE